LFGTKPDIDDIFSFIEKPCEEVFEEKSKFGVESYIDINSSSTKKSKEEEKKKTRKGEKSLMKSPASIVHK